MRRMPLSSLAGTAALGAHVLLLLVLVAVPGYAIVTAIRADGAAAIDVGRWERQLAPHTQTTATARAPRRACFPV